MPRLTPCSSVLTSRQHACPPHYPAVPRLIKPDQASHHPTLSFSVSAIHPPRPIPPRLILHHRHASSCLAPPHTASPCLTPTRSRLTSFHPAYLGHPASPCLTHPHPTLTPEALPASARLSQDPPSSSSPHPALRHPHHTVPCLTPLRFIPPRPTSHPQSYSPVPRTACPTPRSLSVLCPAR